MLQIPPVVTRKSFLSKLLPAFSAAMLCMSLPLVADSSGAAEPPAKGPRKAIISTTMFDLFNRPWVSLDHRLEEISTQIDKMAADSRKRYGRTMDLAVFPENALNPRRADVKGDDVLLGTAVELEGPITEVIGAKAREYNTYVVVSFNRIEDRENRVVYNSAVLFDRKGEIAGIYRKVYCIAPMGSDLLEGGRQPGTDFPAFDTDFGRIGMLICWDMSYNDGFEAYAAQDVDLVVWPSMTPQTLAPRMAARRYDFHFVSSTPRENASIIDPAGEIIAQTREVDGVVSQEVDFEYEILHWQPGLDDGLAFSRKYGSKVGFRYSREEDTGIFWSNDPKIPISQMLRELNLVNEKTLRQHTIDVRNEILGE